MITPIPRGGKKGEENVNTEKCPVSNVKHPGVLFFSKCWVYLFLERLHFAKSLFCGKSKWIVFITKA